MKWSLFATLSLAFCGGGYSTVTSGSATSTSSREWLAGHAKWNMSARYDDGTSERVSVAGDLQTDAELRKEGGAIVRLESVRKVIAVDHARGALDGLQRDLDTLMAFYNFRRTHQGYRGGGRTPAKALYDLIAEQWLLPPISEAAEEVPLAS